MKKMRLGKTKKAVAFLLALTLAISALPAVSARAGETEEAYPYVMFAGAKTEGAITVSGNNICINGAIATNGTIAFEGNANVNGAKTEHADEEIIMALSKMLDSYFAEENTVFYDEETVVLNGQSDFSKPMVIYGDATVEGNVNFNTQMMADEDIRVQGNVLNGTGAVLCSKVGDISLSCDNINLSGLIYAPYGDVEITAQNVNMNRVVIIADTITIHASGVNMGYDYAMAKTVGTESEYGVIGEGEGVLYAYAEYNAEGDSIDIMWYTNVFRNAYEVMVSEDNEAYTVVGTGSYDCEYSYELTEDFEKRYFKVSAGEIESIPFVVVKDGSGYHVEDVDSDGDGLADLLEVSVGTDKDNCDTDGDGRSDYQELYVTKTNPLAFDIAESDESETDTDGDGASDDWETANFYNPLVKDTSFAVSAEWNTEATKASVVTTLAGEQIHSLVLEGAENERFLDLSIPGYVSEPVAFAVDGAFENATLSFAFDETLADDYFDPVIYRFDAECQVLEETETAVEGTVASAVVGETGIYLLVNRADYNLLWELNSDVSFFAGETPAYVDASGMLDSNEDGISDYDTWRMCQGTLLMGTGAYTPFYGMSYEEIQSNDDYDNDGLLNGEEIFLLQTFSDSASYVRLLSDPSDTDSDYDGIPDAKETEEYRLSNTFDATVYSKQGDTVYDVSAEFTMDYRMFFGDNTAYNQKLALLACMFATDMYNNNYLTISTQSLGSTKESEQVGNGVTLGSLFGLSGKNYNSADIQELANGVDTDDISEFYIGHRRVTYQGETRDIIFLAVRGTNGTHTEWSSNFDVGADTEEYSDRTGSHADWKTRDNHKGFDVTANRIMTLVDEYMKDNGLDTSSVPKTLFITGHSRGAAIANILGAYYEKQSVYDTFVYTLATPYTTTASDYASYKTIFNVINTDDLVTYLPLGSWGFHKYGTDKKISVAEKYERTGGSLPGSFEEVIGEDYNDNGWCNETVDAFKAIANNRETLYKLDTSADGTVWITNKWHLTKNGAKKEMETVKTELTNEKLLRYCNLYVGGGGLLYHVDTNYTPAYFMQTLANMASGVPPLAGRDVKGKYVTAKQYFALGSGKVLGALHVGGMEHPHMPLTYFLIVNNDFKNIK